MNTMKSFSITYEVIGRRQDGSPVVVKTLTKVREGRTNLEAVLSLFRNNPVPNTFNIIEIKEV